MVQEPDNKPQSKDQHKQEDNQKKVSPLKNVAILSGIGIEMGVIIYLFVMLGKWLDLSYNDSGKLYVVICTLLGVGISLFVVVKQLNRIKY
ncbi:AtpZ/AtpI family protein [Psychroserpens jangbogonensis]|uniref:AtpZ/AtpI family protein n=1 Tax=Psychroserpens jangbogonensis TaxID=1484460 RepID=UPI0009DDE216|nr:AtpZ/AtpI family protein [Psychroserpens jangbogonensis]